MARQTTKRTVAKARNLRREMSLPEVLLWRILRARPAELKFRRQHPAGPYVLDFYCPEAKLGFEIDGFAHNTGDRPARDVVRDRWLADQGITVIRTPAADVLKSPADVAETITATCAAALQAPPPR